MPAKLPEAKGHKGPPDALNPRTSGARTPMSADVVTVTISHCYQANASAWKVAVQGMAANYPEHANMVVYKQNGSRHPVPPQGGGGGLKQERAATNLTLVSTLQRS